MTPGSHPERRARPSPAEALSARGVVFHVKRMGAGDPHVSRETPTGTFARPSATLWMILRTQCGNLWISRRNL